MSVPWTTRRSNQSILKEISPEYSLEVLMLKWTTEDEIVGWHHRLNGHELEQALSRDIALPTKVRLVKATVFPVVMYGCES